MTKRIKTYCNWRTWKVRKTWRGLLIELSFNIVNWQSSWHKPHTKPSWKGAGSETQITPRAVEKSVEITNNKLPHYILMSDCLFSFHVIMIYLCLPHKFSTVFVRTSMTSNKNIRISHNHYCVSWPKCSVLPLQAINLNTESFVTYAKKSSK